MGFGVKTWLFAAAAAVLNTAAMFCAYLAEVSAQMKNAALSPLTMVFPAAAIAFTAAEYIYFGRKDEGRQRIYRFVQHNVLSFFAAYGGFVVYTAAGLQERYVLDTVIFNTLIPACFQRFFLVTAVGAIVCMILSAAGKRKHNNRENTLAEKQAK